MKMGTGWFSLRIIPKKCEICEKWEKDYAKAISYIAELEDELMEWDLESILERRQVAIILKKNGATGEKEFLEEDEKRLKNIKQLVDLIDKYKNIEENM